MARCTAVPQDPNIDANSSSLAPIVPLAGVVHDTIGVYTGPESGDAEYIEQHRLAHFVVGEDDGEWVQLFDTNVFCAHANGANRAAFGIEFSRLQAGMPLTPWQRDCWATIRAWAVDAHQIPNTYVDPMSIPAASVWVNGREFHGWISHLNVMTDDNTPQHVDWIPFSDAVGQVNAAQKKDDGMQMFIQLQGDTGVWNTDGVWKRWVGPDEWQFWTNVAAYLHQPAPQPRPVSQQWFDSIPTAK